MDEYTYLLLAYFILMVAAKVAYSLYTRKKEPARPKTAPSGVSEINPFPKTTTAI